MTGAGTRTGRQRHIVEILERESVRTQAELAQRLEAAGYRVTQATLSRDLDDLGAVKIVDDGGGAVYAVPGEGGDSTPVSGASGSDARRRLARVAAEVVVSVEGSANLVIVRTPPGAAQYLASAFDHSGIDEIIGTIAGDDTVLLVTRRPTGASSVAAVVLALAGHGSTPGAIHTPARRKRKELT